MKGIDDDDVKAIREYESLWKRVDRAVFKLSTHRAFMEIAADQGVSGASTTADSESSDLEVRRTAAQSWDYGV